METQSCALWRHCNERLFCNPFFYLTDWSFHWLCRGDIQTLSALLAHCEGNQPVTGGFTLEKVRKAELWLFFVINMDKVLNKQSSVLRRHMLWKHQTFSLHVHHYSDDIMSRMATQTTGVFIVCLTVCSGVDQKNIKAPRHWPSS